MSVRASLFVHQCLRREERNKSEDVQVCSPRKFAKSLPKWLQVLLYIPGRADLIE